MSLPSPVASLNDAFRTTFIGGRVLMTEGISSLQEADLGEVLELVRTFTDFTPDNDPYGEHDFGSIDHNAAGRVFWKIDYYDPSMEAGSENPADTSVTVRVLTIMLASEY